MNAAAALRALHAAGIDAVGGRQATRRALGEIDTGPAVHVAAIGKAAAAMALGAREVLGDSLVRALVATKYDHLDATLSGDPRISCLESAHPVPDAASLASGEALVEFVRSVPDEAHLLVLLSGGASALIEKLVDGASLESLRARTDALLAEGVAIGDINRSRRELSLIKGGALAGFLGACRVTQLMISDVPGDHPEDIGSGPLIVPSAGADRLSEQAIAAAGRIDTRIIASSAIAQRAVVDAARASGLTVVQPSGSLDGDVEETARRLTERLLAPGAESGVYVWGGEPTVNLPASPGRGGRNQHLALRIATLIAGHDELTVLVCATDGSDGPTSDAGGLVDGGTLGRGEALGLDAGHALETADAGTWLERAGALVSTGPTGTNVMDLAIAIRRDVR